MIVYRISLSKWASKLSASGFPARWNSKGKFVVYTAGSKALACLENVVHRSGEGLSKRFKVMLIQIPPRVKMTEIKIKQLPKNWYKYENHHSCQKIGDSWLDNDETAILKVPSAIITSEFNYLINPNHKDFRHIKLKEVESFRFDPRLKS